MTECIHGLDEKQCGTCTSPGKGTRPSEGGMAGKSFALVYIPSVRADTFLHLNRQGDHWKLRSYRSAHEQPIEIAQSGRASTRTPLDFGELEIVYELAFPFSTSPGGVTVMDSRYWFDEIAKANASYNITG